MRIQKMDDGEALKRKTDFLFEILKRYDHYIATTNFKVALIMSFLATVILGLLGLTVRIMTLPDTGDQCDILGLCAIITVSATIIASLVSEIQLFRSVFPQTGDSKSVDSVIYFGSVTKFDGGSQAYAERIQHLSEKTMLSNVAVQVHAVAGIVEKKFGLLKSATIIVGVLVVPLLAASLLMLIVLGAR